MLTISGFECENKSGTYYRLVLYITYVKVDLHETYLLRNCIKQVQHNTYELEFF